ncbi:MAG TPA: HYR domain-containing protein [Myxococcales bacterium]|nr:HYR domain-containing protein [Myxococcales bacterium]
MNVSRISWWTMLWFAAMGCGGAKAPGQAARAAQQRALTQPAPSRVLVLADADTPGTAALVAALTAAGNQVTERTPPEFEWDGLTPSPDAFDCIVHLDGTTFAQPLPEATQIILDNWVRTGGGFVAAQWDGFELEQGQQTAMPDIVVQSYGGTTDDNCADCDITYTPEPGQESHPVLAGLPSPFTFRAEGHDAGPQVAFAVQPSVVLMRAPSGGPGVVVREFGSGRVVQFSFAPNSIDGSSLTNPDIQKLYANAVAWAARRPQDSVIARAGSDMTVEATGPLTTVLLDGSLSSGPTTAFTWSDGTNTVANSSTTEVQLTVGVHTFVLTVSDANGNTSTATVTVTVVDTRPPVLSLPAGLTAEATGPSGAAVGFAAAAADLVDGAVVPTCVPASGSPFALGDTTVTCSAVDAHGNAGSGAFVVTVVDTTPPALQVPADLSVVASSVGGQVVTYAATATDLVDGSVAPACAPASGSLFAPGTTTVSCSAQDAHGNASAPASFHVQVQFAWSGLFSPLLADGSAVFDSRSFLAVRFQLTGASAGITNLSAHLFVAPVDSTGALGPQQPATAWVFQNGRAVRTNVFAFYSGKYVLLAPLMGFAQGRWAFVVDLGDGLMHATQFTVVSRHRDSDGDDDSTPPATLWTP